MPQMYPMFWMVLAFLFLSFYLFMKTNKNPTMMTLSMKQKQIFMMNKNIKW